MLFCNFEFEMTYRPCVLLYVTRSIQIAVFIFFSLCVVVHFKSPSNCCVISSNCSPQYWLWGDHWNKEINGFRKITTLKFVARIKSHKEE